MKVIKRILLALLVIIVVMQVPFIYRRYKIGQIADKIAQTDAARPLLEDTRYREYKGIIHAHTSLGGHSTGGFDELINAANANDLDFVLMTEHWSDAYDTSALTLNGVYGKTLFIGGNEIDTADGDRFLMIPGSADAAGMRKMSTPSVIEKLHAENRLGLITYPEKFESWDSDFDGVEVFSVHTNAKQMNPLTAVGDMLWSYPSYPAATLASYFRRPDASLAKFDAIATQRNISLFAGTDAHSNIGFHLFGDDAGNKLVNIKLDPYKNTFALVRLHVLLEEDKPFGREALIDAIRTGGFFIGFDALGDTSGFRFSLTEGENVTMGGTVVGAKFPQLTLEVPANARVSLLRDGQPFGSEEVIAAAKMSKQPFPPGAYRVEVYRDDLGPPFDQMPWILSNPIYVR